MGSHGSCATLERYIKVATTNEDAIVSYAFKEHDIQKFYQQYDIPMRLYMFGVALDGTMIMEGSRDSVPKMKVTFKNGSFPVSTTISMCKLAT